MHCSVVAIRPGVSEPLCCECKQLYLLYVRALTYVFLSYKWFHTFELSHFSSLLEEFFHRHKIKI